MLTKVKTVCAADGFPGFTFTFEVHSHHVEWRAYQVAGKDASGELLYGDLGADDMSLAAAPVYAHGDLKWDGCVNLHFDAQEDCMLHFCGPNDGTLETLMRGVYSLGPEMGSWMP